ncbi:ChrR family anti-sigma-E factor [Thalassotalea euphylliae]|uniref:ChrR family anti-sigma-E factor n=1 Tax=Thalassotalea euphylliae TaxID=1655234 RepID=UPI00363B962E
MIKHHPTKELLVKFAEGDLPASLAAAVAVHVDMCPKCAEIVAEASEQNAFEAFEMPEADTQLDALSITDMIDAITASEEIAITVDRKEKHISVKGQDYKLPTALTNMAMGSWTSLGKLARARFDVEEGPLHASLLQIQPGGTVPEHTHKGFELTLLLDGYFEDEMGTYGPGDFIMLDGEHTHNPTTENGCLCYTVADDALHFTQGFNKLLNPIGSLIY